MNDPKIELGGPCPPIPSMIFFPNTEKQEEKGEENDSSQSA